jgi:hypothetical protein
MTETNNQDLREMNERLLFLLGYSTALIFDYKRLEAYHNNADRCDWLLNSIEDVVYRNKPINMETLKE